MKKLLLAAPLLLLSCKKSHLDGAGCDEPPYMVFELVSHTGQPAVVAPDTVLTVSYQLTGEPAQRLTLQPQRAKELHDYVYATDVLASHSIGRAQTYYLTVGGHTDTLTLQAKDECGYLLGGTFDGQPVARTGGTGTMPDYYRLVRR